MSAVIDHPYREFERSGWERAASAYSGTFAKATELFSSSLLEAAGVRAEMDLLDVACGTGIIASHAAALGARATGVDFSAKMIGEAMRLHTGARFFEADAEALPFPDNSFEAVVSNFGMHHFPFPRTALREAHRVARPGGRVAFTVWATPDKHALQKITLDALREAGVQAACLPTPPSGPLNEPDACIELLREAGFAGATLRAREVVASLWLDSEQTFVDMLIHGTVRLSTAIRSQPPAMLAAIVEAIRRRTAAYREGSRLRIPLVAILATGIKGEH